MNFKKISLMALGTAICATSVAAPRTKSDIMAIACETLVRGDAGISRMATRATSGIRILNQNKVFSVVGYQDGSYAIVSNDDLLPEVLGYSASPFTVDTDNSNFRWWMEAMQEAGEEIIKSGIPANHIAPDTQKYPAAVPQMMSNVWGQMAPFNDYCPLEYDANGKLIGRCVVGCVATSSTQVMHYHQYPSQGHGVHVDMQTVDAFNKPIPLKVNLSDYFYDYSKMRDSMSPGTYTKEEADAVAGLSYSVGVTFGMIYSTGASGTYSDSAAYALKKYFGFPNAQKIDRYGVNEQVWMDMIFKELSENRPVLYSGADDFLTVGGGGHAFVFDGYDENGLVHVNWGWFGRNDGYYEVALLNPRIHSFKNQQDMIIGVAPPDQFVGNPELKLTGNITLEDIANAVEKSKSEGIRVLDLKNAVLPGGVIPNFAFYSSLFKKIILPDNTVKIGDGAFGKCRNLVEVVFPTANSDQQYIVEDNIIYSKDGKIVIEVLPYYWNNDLVITDYNSLLKFREGVTELRPHAADGCFRIKGVEIPATVTKIGEYAFANATNMKVVFSRSVVPSRATYGAWEGVDPGFTRLIVPAGVVDTYYRCGEWNKFFAFDNVYEYGTNVVANNAVRAVGESNPEFTYRIFGEYVSGEPVLTCSATKESPAGEYPIVVEKGTLNGESVMLTNGVLRVIGESGVDAVDMENGPFDVYSIDGKMILHNAESLNGLDKGIYIVNGHKIIVK
ncbi:MAG: C10 family peptidase [Muribaculum sp.]|nr:C10 family peptidase [Muribaculum sp.]